MALMSSFAPHKSTRSRATRRARVLTVTNQRSSMKIESIELLECPKSWFRLGIFTEQDLHLIVSKLEEV